MSFSSVTASALALEPAAAADATGTCGEAPAALPAGTSNAARASSTHPTGPTRRPALLVRPGSDLRTVADITGTVPPCVHGGVWSAVGD
jgi:hypothetical protein